MGGWGAGRLGLIMLALVAQAACASIQTPAPATPVMLPSVQSAAPATPSPAPSVAVLAPAPPPAAQPAPPMDWPALGRYRSANAMLTPAAPGQPRIVFMGDSITQNWASQRASFFTDHGFVGRGISGQTSSQMVLRFHQDVIGLTPAAVLILAGTNDVAENTGPITDEQIIANLEAMVEMARAHGIKVVIGSVPPATTFFWNRAIQPTARIQALNVKIRAWAAAQNLIYADFWTAMAQPDGTTIPALANDSVHPNAAGYGVMEPIALSAIAQALARP